MIVMHWIRQPSNKYQDYVAHRIADVNSNLESLSASGQRLVEIRYVPTSLNVADGGTCGLQLSQMSAASPWQKGLEFLSRSEDDWPQKLDEEEEVEDMNEVRNTVHTKLLEAQVEEDLVDLAHYSTLQKVKRVMAYVLKFVSLMKGGLSSREKDGLTVEELH